MNLVITRIKRKRKESVKYIILLRRKEEGI
jgi:hypothetical protein